MSLLVCFCLDAADVVAMGKSLGDIAQTSQKVVKRVQVFGTLEPTV